MCPIVEFIVGAGLAAEMLAAHIDNGTGHCRGCAWQDASTPVWPCSIRYYAARADEAERRRDPHRPRST